MKNAPRYNLTRRPRTLATLALIAALAATALLSDSYARAARRLRAAVPADAAFVTTDQTDYKPGDTVVITGSGWAAGETVKLVVRPSASESAEAELSAEADEYGNILNKEFTTKQEHLGASFTLNASGQTSGRTAEAKFTDGGIMNYSPNSVALSAFSGPSGSSTTGFTQTVTAPSGNGNFQAPAVVSSVSVSGSIAMPASWVSVTGGTGNFNTGPANNPKNPPDFKLRNVSVTPAANAAPGTYSAIVTSAPAAGSGVGAGQGTVIQLTVTTDNAPPTTTLSAVDSNNNAYGGVNFTNANKVTITLSATDAGGSGIQVTRYKIENGNFQDYSGPFDISAEGVRTVTYFSIDNTGAQETAQTFNVKIDKTAPAVNCGSADGQWHATDVNITCTAVDGGGQQKSGLANASDASFSLSTNVPADTEDPNAATGTHQVCDNAGNCATAGPIAGNMIDKKAPDYDCDDPSTSWLAIDAVIPCTASDGGSGTSTTTFSLYTSVPADTDDANASTNSQQVCDAVGNCTTAGPISGNMIDKKAPSVSASAAKADSSAYNPGDWTNQDVTVSYSCDDGMGSGVASVDGPDTLSAEGSNQSATGQCTDNVGHTSSATFQPVNIDKTKPTLNFDSYTPAPNGAGWNNTDVSVAYTAADALSGVASATPSSPLVLSAEGSAVTGSVTVTDVAGNSETFTTAPVKIDKTKPTLAPARHAGSEANGAGWNNSDVTVDANASDGLSGIASVSPAASQTVTTEGANQSVSFTATDAAGNSEMASLGGINIDKTAPAVTAKRNPLANSFGWNNTDVTVSVDTATDALSGVASTSAPVTVSTEGFNQSATVSATDAAGNTGTATVSNINIDKTAPSVTISSPNVGPYMLNQAVAASYNCSDGGNPPSGVDACAGTVVSGSNVSTSSVGPHTFTVNASDKAGNTASKSVTYGVVYDWSGFLQPINNDGSSVFKLGSTVPVKFRLVGGSAGVVGATDFTLWVAKVSNNIVGNEVEASTSTPASTGNLFRYDPSGGIYIYNMGTKGTPWTAGTWQLRVDLGDGAPPRTVLISLKP